MKRWTIWVVLCLLLGVATAVGVAWALAWNPPKLRMLEPEPDAFPVFIVLDDETYRYVVIREGVGTLYLDSGGRARVSDLDAGSVAYVRANPPDIPRWSAGNDEWTREINFEGSYVADRAFGWPRCSMRCEALIDERPNGWTLRKTRFALVAGPRLKARPAGPRMMAFFFTDRDADFRLLPLRPILPGFIINTLFYAAIWFVLFLAIGFAKRTIRRKRGRCIKCGYDLRGDLATGCPECGWNREAASP